MDESELKQLLTAITAETKAKTELTAAINKLIESNGEVVDLLIGQMAEVEQESDKPQYLGTRT